MQGYADREQSAGTSAGSGCSHPRRAAAGAAERSEHVAPREQYDRNQHYYRYDHLTGRAVEKSALSLIVRLHRHGSLLG